MAKTTVSSIRAPLDTSNDGKDVAAILDPGAGPSGRDLYPHLVVPRSREKLLGRYRFAMPVQAITQTAQNGTSTAYAWLQMPLAVSRHARLRELTLGFAALSTSAMLTAPRVVLARFTFASTASGAKIDPAKLVTADAGNLLVLRTEATGMTSVTLGAECWARPAPPTLTGVGTSPISEVTFRPTGEDEYLDIAPGEGLVLYQAEGGTSTDSRRFTVDGAWDEYDSA